MLKITYTDQSTELIDADTIGENINGVVELYKSDKATAIINVGCIKSIVEVR